MKKKSLYTYSVPREFYAMNIPIAIQSAYLRQYANDNNFKFHLPIVEWFKEDIYINFFEILENNKLEHFASTSIFILPLQKTELLSTLRKKENPVIFHFPLEKLILNIDQLVEHILYINTYHPLSKSYNDIQNLEFNIN